MALAGQARRLPYFSNLSSRAGFPCEPANTAAEGADPERAIVGGVQSANMIVREARALRQRDQTFVPPAMQTEFRAEPHRAVRRFSDDVNFVPRKFTGQWKARKLSVAKQTHASDRADPERPGVVLRECAHRVLNQSVGFGVVQEKLRSGIWYGEIIDSQRP